MARAIKPGGHRALVGAVGLLAGLALLVPACAQPDGPEEPPPVVPEEAAAGCETRDFAVTVDAKPAGWYRMTITPRGKHSLSLECQAQVRAKVLFYTYKYSYRGTETYQGGQLSHFESRCNDDGKPYEVLATPDGDGLHVRVNGKERVIPSPVWTTSYWKLPAGKKTGAVLLLDADTGKDIPGRLEWVGKTELPVGGRAHPCQHYRVTGPPSPINLWYDAQERLVRQDYTEDGHRTILALKKITRSHPH
jgi:hypothetical protein